MPDIAIYPKGSQYSVIDDTFKPLTLSILLDLNFDKWLTSYTTAEALEDLSWANTTEFKLKIDRAFKEIEHGKFASVRTIDELIEYIDAQREEAQEKP